MGEDNKKELLKRLADLVEHYKTAGEGIGGEYGLGIETAYFHAADDIKEILDEFKSLK